VSPLNLGYVVLGVADIEQWTLLATEALGMQRADPGAAAVAFRMDENAQRLILEPGGDDIVAAGWHFETRELLENFVDELHAGDVEVCAAPAELVEKRCVEALYVCEDAQGWHHEFHAGPARAATPFISPVSPAPSFLTGRFGIGHILTIVKEKEPALKFYQRVLGLRISDTISEEVRPGLVVDATFLHARAGRHHSLAIAELPGSKHLSHLMIEVDDIDDVGRAYDRCVKSGFTMHMGIGRHPNDRCISFYVQTPSGFSIEVGYGSVVIDDDAWQPSHYDRLSEWGHQRRTMPDASVRR
jgi:2,3-dihydroxybiphenyl 1,2-dioxygenase